MAVMDGLYTIEYFARMLKEKPRWSGPGWTPLCTLLHFWLFSHAPDHSAPCASTATTHSSTVRFLRLPRQVNLYLSQIGVRGPRAQPLCISWNRGRCYKAPEPCNFRHVCAVCGDKSHPARECRLASADSFFTRAMPNSSKAPRSSDTF